MAFFSAAVVCWQAAIRDDARFSDQYNPEILFPVKKTFCLSDLSISKPGYFYLKERSNGIVSALKGNLSASLSAASSALFLRSPSPPLRDARCRARAFVRPSGYTHAFFT
jgi:hypothetical protein